MASEWKDIMAEAKDLAKRVSQATREELERAAREIEKALDKGTTELERSALELYRRIVDSARASREPVLFGKEVITSDGVSLGKIRDVRLELESKRIWIVVSRARGERKNIAIDDIRTIGDTIILSLAESEISPEEKV
jgi:sporulation protein YlmC with PRC-barrel domain